MIALSVSISVFISCAYSFLAPKIYEARTLLVLDELSNQTSGKVNDSMVVDLNFSLNFPGSLPPQISSKCSISEINFFGKPFFSLTPVRSSTRLVEFKVFGLSPEAAATCSELIIEEAKVVQKNLRMLSISQLNLELSRINTMLNDVRLYKPQSSLGIEYLWLRDESRLLIDRRMNLESAIASASTSSIRADSPTYISGLPISPRTGLIVISFTLIGIFLGFFIVIGRFYFKFYFASLDLDDGFRS